MRASIPLLYSLARVSTEKQTHKSGIARQLNEKKLDQLSERFQLPKATPIILEGISAFKGRHIEEGPLAAFLEAVSLGEIAENSVLVIDEFSRLSRMSILESQSILSGILSKSIGVYTQIDNQYYHKSDDQLTAKLMMSLMHFQRAHEESVVKQNYTYKATELAIQKFLDKDPSGFKNGKPLAIQSVGRHPFFIDTSDGTVREHDYYYPIAIEIHKLLLSGWGKYKVLNHLNENYRPPQSKKSEATNKAKGITKFWGAKILDKWTQNEALLGCRVINLNDRTYRLEDYYKPIATLGELNRIQEQRNSRQGGQSNRSSPNLLTGMKILKCGYCGHSMSAYTHRNKIRVACNGGRANATTCTTWGFNLARLEDITCRLLVNHIWKETPSTTKNNNDKDEIDAIEKRISEVETEMVNGDENIVSLNKVLSSLNSKRSSILEKIRVQDAEIENSQLDSDLFKLWDNLPPEVLDPENVELRLRTRELIRACTKHILCFKGEKERQNRFIFKLKDGIEYVVKSFSDRVVFPVNTYQGLSLDGDDEAELYKESHLKTWNVPDYKIRVIGDLNCLEEFDQMDDLISLFYRLFNCNLL